MPPPLSRAPMTVQLGAAFLCVSLLPLAVTAGLLAWRGMALIEGYVAENVEKSAQSHAAGLDLFVERQRGRLRELDLAALTPATLTAAVQAEPGLEALWFADGARASQQAPDAWARRACAQMAARPEGLMTHAGEGQAHEVVLGVAREAGLLCAQLTFTPRQDLMSEQADSQLGGSAYIVDRRGVVVCHSLDEGGEHVARGATLSEAAAEVAAAGAPWSGRVEGPEPHVAAFAASSELPWGVWVEVPAARALAPLRAAALQAMGAAGLIALVAAAAALWLARRLGAPLREVAEAVGRAGAGMLGERVPVRGPAEIAHLAAEFNRMSAALASSQAELERRVEDRTRALRAARELSDRLLDTLPQRVIVLDDDLRVARANAAARRARPAEDPGLDEVTVAAAREVLRGGAPSWRGERGDEGAGEVLEVEIVPLRQDDGAPGGVLIVARDVTELRRMQARLAQQARLASVGTLAAGLAHEIGNPLASMSSELELLERHWDPDDARAALPVLRDQVRRMAALLRELVDFGRPVEHGAARFSCESVLNEVIRLIRHDPRARGVALHVEVEPADACVLTSRDKLIQVLVNLGLNALDALGGEGRLTLRARAEGDGLRFEVEDTGPGVPAELVGRVFDPFFTTKAPGRGAGLGLFVSERLARALGGRLELHRPAQGARFALVLPGALAHV